MNTIIRSLIALFSAGVSKESLVEFLAPYDSKFLGHMFGYFADDDKRLDKDKFTEALAGDIWKMCESIINREN